MTNHSVIPSEVEGCDAARTLSGRGQAFHPGAKTFDFSAGSFDSAALRLG
jgi:hypothetical protein